MFKTLEISATGLSAERLRIDVISNNIANANATSSVDGTPYKRKSVLLKSREMDGFITSLDSSMKAMGVEVAGIVEDNSPPVMKYDPGNPGADEEGFVELPNVNILNEMVDMISATRAYEANITAIESTKLMITRTIDMGK
ncbi:MAG: flagellar basal body rod protein FlgC [Actinobacteria bacterium]|nr:flagellar basal body rod protein FlgC [Actinomycetota bacterium]